jgi:hypothetical protein
MATAFIYDGYTQDGLVAGCDLHEEVGFSFRPIYGSERAAVYDLCSKTTGLVGKNEAVNQALCDSLINWSLDGEPTLESIERLHPTVKRNMFQQVMLNKAADEESAKN